MGGRLPCHAGHQASSPATKLRHLMPAARTAANSRTTGAPPAQRRSHGAPRPSLNDTRFSSTHDMPEHARRSLQLPLPAGAASPIASCAIHRSASALPPSPRFQADCHDYVCTLLTAGGSISTAADVDAGSGRITFTETAGTLADTEASLFAAPASGGASASSLVQATTPPAGLAPYVSGDSGAKLRSAAEQLLRKPSRNFSLTSGRPPSTAATPAEAPPGLQAEGGLMATPLELLSGLSGMRFLAKGAFAHVYSATYQGLPVAAKLLTCRHLDRSSPALREALLGRMLQHPNIVAAYATRVARFDGRALQAALSQHECHPSSHQQQRPQSQGQRLRSSTSMPRFRGSARTADDHAGSPRPGGATQAPKSSPSRSGTSNVTPTRADQRRTVSQSSRLAVGGPLALGHAPASPEVPRQPIPAECTSRPKTVPAAAPLNRVSALAAFGANTGEIGLRDVLLGLGVEPGMYVCLSIMEYCCLGSLEGLCTEDAFSPSADPAGPSSAERWLVHVALDIAQGLAYLHTNGLVHGDLKPANVLLRRGSTPCPEAAEAAAAANGGDACSACCVTGQPPFNAVLSDFGLSQLTAGQPGESDSIAHIGTVAYASPERFDGCVLKAPADVYSFGLVLWQMAAGQRPYKGLQVGQIIGGVMFRNLRPKWPEDRHAHLRPLYETCIAQEPLDRPTAEQLVAQLASLERTMCPH